MSSYTNDWQSLERRITYDVPSEEWLDDEYDEYEFCPSISPYALFPVAKQVGLLPPLPEGDLLQVRALDDALQRLVDGL